MSNSLRLIEKLRYSLSATAPYVLKKNRMKDFHLQLQQGMITNVGFQPDFTNAVIMFSFKELSQI